MVLCDTELVVVVRVNVEKVVVVREDEVVDEEEEEVEEVEELTEAGFKLPIL